MTTRQKQLLLRQGKHHLALSTATQPAAGPYSNSRAPYSSRAYTAATYEPRPAAATTQLAAGFYDNACTPTQLLLLL